MTRRVKMTVLAAAIAVLSVAGTVAVSTPANAATHGCYGAGCNGMDPI